jgi:SAM-dependent methyltransferase
MITNEKKTFFATYDWAKDWRDLPWAHEEPMLFLPDICQERRAGRALDIGCGAGTDSVFLARQGWEVTSLDFMPKALEYTRRRAEAAGVRVTPVEADITEWEIPHAYDLVVDHGLLHNMDPVRHPVYRQQILRALAGEGDFALLHWHPRYPGQANGKMGPRRVPREDIQAFFAPELQERYFALEEFEDLPDLVGGGMRQACYWFRRSQSHLKPGELLEQIRATLRRHDVDLEKALREAGNGLAAPEVSAELLARILGPGRLGISHRIPEAAEVGGILQSFAAHAAVAPGDLENLFRIFASDRHGKICNAGAPKCTECEVNFCKRLRYR